MVKRRTALALLALAVLLAVPALQGQGQIPPPKFGQYTSGDDYFLANYTQLLEYWNSLAKVSDRIKVVEVAKSSEGRPFVMAIITSPENHKRLARYKEISHTLAMAEGLNDDEARKLAAEGKVVVWIDGGLHGTEVTGAQHLAPFAYQMVSQSDPETMRILNDDILLLVPINPDGMEAVSNWYMKDSDVKQRSYATLPRLYNKYVGHDDNRDSYANNQLETIAASRQFFIEWHPQVMYNQHQTGPSGVMVFVPPFRDPFNYNTDGLAAMETSMVGNAMHTRLVAEGKPGTTGGEGANYSTWFNGGIRTATYFHNMVGILTEMKGQPTPIEIVFVPERQLASNETPLPIAPQVWHFKQSLEYTFSLDRAVLDTASRHREQFLFNMYKMGRNSIEKGSKDNWTVTPKRVKAVLAAFYKDNPKAPPRPRFARFAETIPSKYYEILKDPAYKDPRGFIVPSDQPDFLTATKFVNKLIQSGIIVSRATSAFQVAGKSYPAGSYVFKTAQAFRPHLMDMFEPQDHPDDIPYPGGPPTPPYDVAGYTLAFQMGVKFDRIMDAFDGPFEKLPFGETIKTPAGKVTAPAKGSAVGYFLDHQVNDAFTATNRLLAGKEEVYWLKSPFTAGGKTYPVGSIYVPNKPTTKALLEKLAAEIGVSFEGSPTKPTGDAFRVRPVRVGLWDQYGGSMPSGWIRWMFEQQYQFTTFEVVYPPVLDAGNLNAKFDVLIFPDDGIPERDGGMGSDREGVVPSNLPPEWKDKVGTVTIAKTIPQLKQFVENGGTIIAIGESARLAYHFGLPVTNGLVERLSSGVLKELTSEKFYAPGSIMRASVDNSNPTAFGVPAEMDIFYQNSPMFRLAPDAELKGVHPILWIPTAESLRSGWAWGQGYLKDTVGGFEATMGKGKVFIFGPEITFRGQPHAAFKFLFNGIYLGGAQNANLAQAGSGK